MEHYWMILKNTVDSVKNAYYVYAGSSINLLLFYLAAFYLFCSLGKKTAERRQDKAVLCFALVTVFVIIFPFTAWFIMKYCVEEKVYRRMFWMVPVPLIIGYAMARIVTAESTKRRRWLAGILFALIIVVTGSGLYNNVNFAKAANPYKVPDSVIKIGDALREDAAQQGYDKIRVIVSGEPAIYLRQYDAGIAQAFGRDQMEGRSEGKAAKKIYEALGSAASNADALAFCAKESHYPYLVYGADEALIPVFAAAGYELVADVGEYYVYRLEM